MVYMCKGVKALWVGVTWSILDASAGLTGCAAVQEHCGIKIQQRHHKWIEKAWKKKSVRLIPAFSNWQFWKSVVWTQSIEVHKPACKKALGRNEMHL